MSVLNELIEYKQRDSALGTEYLTRVSSSLFLKTSWKHPC